MNLIPKLRISSSNYLFYSLPMVSIFLFLSFSFSFAWQYHIFANIPSSPLCSWDPSAIVLGCWDVTDTYISSVEILDCSEADGCEVCKASFPSAQWTETNPNNPTGPPIEGCGTKCATWSSTVHANNRECGIADNQVECYSVTCNSDSSSSSWSMNVYGSSSPTAVCECKDTLVETYTGTGNGCHQIAGFPWSYWVNCSCPSYPVSPSSVGVDVTGRQFIQHNEGFGPFYYLDSSGKITIGYGHWCGTASNPKCQGKPFDKGYLTVAESEVVQTADISANIGKVYDLKDDIDDLVLTQNQFNVLADIAFQFSEASLDSMMNSFLEQQAKAKPDQTIPLQTFSDFITLLSNAINPNTGKPFGYQSRFSDRGALAALCYIDADESYSWLSRPAQANGQLCITPDGLPGICLSSVLYSSNRLSVQSSQCYPDARNKNMCFLFSNSPGNGLESAQVTVKLKLQQTIDTESQFQDNLNLLASIWGEEFGQGHGFNRRLLQLSSNNSLHFSIQVQRIVPNPVDGNATSFATLNVTINSTYLGSVLQLLQSSVVNVSNSILSNFNITSLIDPDYFLALPLPLNSSSDSSVLGSSLAGFVELNVTAYNLAMNDTHSDETADTPGSSSSMSTSSTGIIVGAVIGPVGALIIILAVVYYCLSQQRSSSKAANAPSPPPLPPRPAFALAQTQELSPSIPAK